MACCKDCPARCGAWLRKLPHRCWVETVNGSAELWHDLINFSPSKSWAWASENLEWANGLCLWQLWKDVNPNKINPEMYLGAWVETFIIMLAMSWTVTLIWAPEVIETNRIKDVMGYNNVCVGFDEAPARYVALPGMVAMSYFGITYVNMDMWRDKLQEEHHDISKKAYMISRWSNILFAATMLLWPMLLIVTPGGDEDWHFAYHFYIYVIFVVIAMANIGANFSEAHKITVYSKVWMLLFGLDTFLLLTVGAVAFNIYDIEKCPNSLAATPNRNATVDALCRQDPRISIGFLGFLDYMWFVFLGFTPIFLPDAPAIILHPTLKNDETSADETVLKSQAPVFSGGAVDADDAVETKKVEVTVSGGGAFNETTGPMELAT